MKKLKRVLITGISQGLGKALAEEFSTRNYEVIETARQPMDIQIDGIYKKPALDITKPQMIEELVCDIGNVDILINNAVISASGPEETNPILDAKGVFEINFFSPVRMMESVIPTMRDQGKGTIVNIISSASKFSPGYGGVCVASKAALELVSEKFRFELLPFGIEVRVMQCGTVGNKISMPGQMHVSEEYAGLDKQTKEGFENHKKRGDRLSSKNVAIQVIENIEARHRPFKTIIGNDVAHLLKPAEI